MSLLGTRLLASVMVFGLSGSAFAQPKADAGSGPTSGSAATNDAGSGPTKGANPGTACAAQDLRHPCLPWKWTRAGAQAIAA
jgi:hypothetical protein